MGFIPDIYIILAKYNLLHFIHTYILTGRFPFKIQWKSIIKRVVELHAKSEKLNTLLELWPKASEFLPKINNPCVLFTREIYSKAVRRWIMSLISVIGKLFSRHYVQNCQMCNAMCLDIIDHVLNFCVKVENIRQSLWSYMFDIMGITAYTEWIKCARENQTDEIVILTFNQATCRQYTLLKMLYNMFKFAFSKSALL